jgi:PPOX class probable F420-dependent enzyme
MPEIPDSHHDLVGPPRPIGLSTLNADGSVQTTAVWVLLDDDGLVRMSLATSRQKYRNLTRDPRATLFAIDTANPYRTLEVRATAAIVPDDEARTFTLRLCAGYGMDAEAAQPLLDEDRVVVTFTPTRVVANG